MSSLYSADWYVRPAGGSYGNEDGTSYANAWDGLLNVAWGEGGVQPGDTLWVCDLHIHNMVNKDYVTTQADIPVISGTGESTWITIRGDYPGDPGTVWGAYGMGYEAWIDEGDGVWSISLPGNQYPDWFFEDITAASWKVLDKASSLDACRSTPGSHYNASDYTGGTKLYIHCSDSGNPTGRIYANRWGYDWKINGKHYIAFLNLKMFCPYRFSWAGSGIVATHMKWEGCTLWYGEHSLICPLVDCHYWEVKDCDLAWASNGIYNVNQTSDYGSPNNYVYSGNTIHEMGVRPVNQNSDAHAIGIQGGYDGIIEDNYCYNCGNAILIYAFTNQELKNTLVRRNFVRDSHALGGTSGWGISTQCDNDSLSDKSGNKFYQNIVANCSVGFRFQFEDEQEAYNNVTYNCPRGIESSRNYNDTGANVTLKNNIFYNSSSYHIWWGTGASNFTINSDYNLFYPDTGTKFRYKGTDYNFTDWKTQTDGDSHSLTSDPLFVNGSGNYSLDTDFKIPSNSPAKDAGTDVSLALDYFRNTIPSGSAPDIGVHEYQQGGETEKVRVRLGPGTRLKVSGMTVRIRS